MKTKLQKVSCLIIDDEPLAIKVIQEHLDKLGDRFFVKTFADPVEAFSFLSQNRVDLIFLDINMPQISGLDLIKSLSRPPRVVFTTAYRNFAVDAFEINAVDYLVKPVSFQRFLMAIEKFMEVGKPQKEDGVAEEYMIFKENKTNHRVALHDLYVIESMDNYLKIHTGTGVITCYGNLVDLEERLGSSFLRIHRSFIVNTHHINSYTSSVISIQGKKLSIGRSYREMVLNFLKADLL